jgi:hypothetical protein
VLGQQINIVKTCKDKDLEFKRPFAFGPHAPGTPFKRRSDWS